MKPKKKPLLSQLPHTFNAGATPVFLTLGLCASPLVLAADNQNQSEWYCQPAGDSWDCSQRVSNSPAYTRPQQQQLPAAAAKITVSARTAAEQDWVAKDLLTPEQQALVEELCCNGMYRAPARKDDEAQLNPEKSPARITADRSEWKQEITTVMEGDVRVTKGYRELKADKATINQVTRNVTLEGNIRVREPGLLLMGERADLNMESGAAEIQNASYLLHETAIRGEAEAIARGGDETLRLSGASLTRCEPGDNTWVLKGSELKVNPKTNQGTGKHVRLNVKGVPILYVPYLRFPTSSDRQSGLLYPSISSSDSGGLDITVPYYFNLAPSYDLTLSPRYISDRGAMLEAEARHLSKHFETTVSGAFLSSDDGGGDDDLRALVRNGSLTEEEAYPHLGQDRWLISVDQKGGRGARWYSTIDYTDVSDEDYFRDMDTASLQVNSSTHLKKSGTLGYRGRHWQSRLRVEEFESLTTRASTPYQQLPRLNLDGAYRLGKNWLVELENEYTYFDHRDKDEDRLLTGSRAVFNYNLGWDKQWSWGFFKPTVGVRSLNYQLDDKYLKAGADDAPSFTAGQGSIDTGLFFERDGSLFSNQYLQTFEPRLFYLYRDHANQDDLIRVTEDNRSVNFDTSEFTYSYHQLFRDTRFSGNDRIDDADRLSVGLTTRFIDPYGGREWLSISLGQIIYFDDRAIDLSQTSEEILSANQDQSDNSEYAAELSSEFATNWQWRTSLTWDSDNGDRVTRGSSSLRYNDDNNRVFNLSYRYLRKNSLIDINDADGDGFIDDELEQTVEQGDISLAMPIWGNWSVFARHNYDFTHQRELESLLGVEYNNCCYAARLVVRRWLDNDLIDVVDTLDLEEDEGIFFEFYLKSLGGIGNKVTGILADSIYGYQSKK